MWTYPPRRLLVAVDFGEASARALRVAGELARIYGVRVSAIHAETFEAPPYFTSEQVNAIEEQRRAAGREAARYLGTTASRTAGVDVQPMIAEGPPADAILRVSRDFDLVLMGTHGRRGPARWWAGSVAERVARESAVPLMIVRAAESPVVDLFASIVTVAPGGVFDGPARRYAKGLATRFKTKYAADSAFTSADEVPEHATLVVIAQPDAKAPTLAAGAAERVLRAMRRPVLLVPAV